MIEAPPGLDPEAMARYSATITFILSIYPCQVSSFTVTQASVAPVEYILDTPGFNFGQYSFTQSNDCGYDVAVETVGLPSFVELRAA